MKKILSLVLAMLMIFSMVPAVFAAETSESDYQAAIEYLKALELYKGTTDGDAADELVERYQMALFTARMVTGRVDKAYWETDANDSDFTDIDELNAEALGGVCYAAQQGIVNGIGGSEFAPFDNVTYRDAIVMIVRALGFNYPASGYPWSYINKARELGVLDGITGVAYTAEVKREVIAQLLYNAMNAEIKGETIAANVFGVEETIVMVTATPQVVYSANSALSVKSDMVRVAAVDAEGEPIGTEYYVPFAELGCKNLPAANKLVGTTVKLTHRGNFAEFLAVERLSKVFENTPDKKEVTYAINDGLLTIGGKTYYALRYLSDNYSNINHAQGTLSGKDEIKIFKAYGATQNDALNIASDFILAADGNIYRASNPFVPYAVYSALVDRWFKVITDNIVTTPDTTAGNLVTSLNKRYQLMDPDEVKDILEKTTHQVMGFARQETGTFAPFATKIANSYGVHYDYFEAIASDTDGDGDYDRVTMRPYELLRVSKQTVSRKVDGAWTNVTVFQTTSFKNPVNDALNGHFNDGETVTSKLMTTTQFKGISFTDITDDDKDTPVDSRLGNVYLYRSTGISIDKVPNDAFVVAYVNDGVNSEREIDIVEVIGGEQKNADDNAYVFQTYIRGYDSVTNNIIYGENYDTMYFGTYAVKNSSAFDAPHAYSDNRGKYTASTAKYVQQFWNKYVNVYVLNGAVIYIEEVGKSNDYVILESFTDFTEDGLKAMAYSTKDGGYAEVTIGELDGWSLGGYDYELFMLLKQMTDLGLTVKDYKLPIFLNKIYAVRSVDENGAYNLAEPVALNKGNPASIYVNNFGYVLGVDQYGDLNANGRVATSDKDLWIIQTQKCVAEELDATTGKMVPHNSADCKGLTNKCEVVKSNVVMFKGKLSAIQLVGFTWYKVSDNQYVAVAPVGYELGPILGNTSEGLDYWMYNRYINNYKNETLYNGFYYGHYMTNVRTSAVEFVTYDSKLASDLFLHGNTNYIVLEEGGIYPAINKVLKTNTATTMKAVADFEAANHKYHAYHTAYVGAVLPVGYLKDESGNFVKDADDQKIKILDADVDLEAEGIDAAYVSYNDLRDAIALNLYAGVYGNDFTNAPTHTDVYAQIRKELLANVTFIHRTSVGAYESWKGYKSSDNTFPKDDMVLGSDKDIVKAYVLYDYANASAKVFIDSATPKTITDINNVEVTVNGVSEATANVIFSYNGFKGVTDVTVTFNKSLNITSYNLGAEEVSNLVVSNLGFTYTVADNFQTAPSFVATDAPLTDLAQYKAEDITALAQGGFKNSPAIAKLCDGNYHTGTAVGDGDVALTFNNFATIAYDSQLVDVGGEGKTGAMYYGFVKFQLANKAVLKGFRYAGTSYENTPIDSAGNTVDKDQFLFQSVAVLVSEDGTNWHVAGTYYDTVDKGLWKDVADANNRDYLELVGSLSYDKAVEYVAIAIPDASIDRSNRENEVTDGLPKYKAGNYAHALEFEFYVDAPVAP